MDTVKQNACMEHDVVVPNSGEKDMLQEDTSGIVSDDLYNPWLVVTKRSANKEKFMVPPGGPHLLLPTN